MKRRIFVALLVMTVVSSALFFVPTVLTLRSVALQTQEVDLQIEAFEAARAYEDEGALALTDHHSLAVYSAGGRLLVGEGPPTADPATSRALEGRATTVDNGGIVVVALPLSDGGVLRAAEPDARSGDRATRAIVELAIVAMAVVVASVLTALYLSRRLNRPLVALASSASRLGAGDFRTRVAPSGLEELDEVASALNLSARRLGDLVERERQLTADMAHQLRTPLAGLRLAVEAELEQPRPDRDEVLHEVLAALDRVEQASTNLITLHRDHVDHDGCSVRDRMLAVAARWQSHASQLGRRIVVLDGWHAVSTVRSGALDTALDVLIENALVHGRGQVTVFMRSSDEGVVVKVADEGAFPGNDDPFLRPRPAGASNGIGLPLARSILSADHASVRLAIRQPTAFAITLPTPVDVSVPQQELQPAGGNGERHG